MHTVMVERRELSRLVRMAEARSLGADPEISQIPPGAENRLLPISTHAILNRWLVAIRKWLPALVAKYPDARQPDYGALEAIDAKPTGEEISDLFIADYMFRSPRGAEGRTLDPQRELLMICQSGEFGGSPADLRREGANPSTPAFKSVVKSDPFFCPRPGRFTPPSYSISTVTASSFGFDTRLPWSVGRQVALNILNLFAVAAKYPWPGVVRALPSVWWDVEMVGLRTLVNQDAPLTQDMIRFWITLATIADYNQIAAIVVDRLKEKAKKERFNAIVTAIGFAAVGAILTAGVALAFTGAVGAGAATTGAAAGTTGSFVQTAVTKGLSVGLGQISTAEKAKAAEGLQDAAEQLKSTDPAFAKEAEWSAEYLKYSIGLQAMEEKDAQAGLPPGTTARPRPPTTPGTGEDKGLIAAVGVAVPALFTAASAFLRA